MPPSRREFLSRLLGAASLPLLPACHESSVAPVAGAGPLPEPPVEPGPPPPASNNGVFAHGVASGDPLADRVILWTRVTAPATATAVELRWRIYADAALTRLLREGTVSTDAARDFTAKVDADGLAPGTSYYYRFEAIRGATGFSPVGRTRTLPAAGAQHLRLALVTCSNNGSVMNGYARVAERADRLVLIVTESTRQGPARGSCRFGLAGSIARNHVIASFRVATSTHAIDHCHGKARSRRIVNRSLTRRYGLPCTRCRSRQGGPRDLLDQSLGVHHLRHRRRLEPQAGARVPVRRLRACCHKADFTPQNFVHGSLD